MFCTEFCQEVMALTNVPLCHTAIWVQFKVSFSLEGGLYVVPIKVNNLLAVSSSEFKFFGKIFFLPPMWAEMKQAQSCASFTYSQSPGWVAEEQQVELQEDQLLSI